MVKVTLTPSEDFAILTLYDAQAAVFAGCHLSPDNAEELGQWLTAYAKSRKTDGV